MFNDPTKLQHDLSEAKKELGELRAHHAYLEGKIQTLSLYISAVERMLQSGESDAQRSGDSDMSSHSNAATVSEQRSEREGSFRSQILAIIIENGSRQSGKHGVSIDTIRNEVTRRGLKSDAATLDAGLYYALNGLKKMGQIKGDGRGIYKHVDP